MTSDNDDGSNGGAGDKAQRREMSATLAKKVQQVRARVRESFGNVAMAMMMLPRYRHQSLADLQHLVLEPLLRDRIAIAYGPAGKPVDEDEPGDGEIAAQLGDVAGMAIWASVSEEVDKKIREQIKANAFPIRLKADEWNCGQINWLFDIIAPDKRTTTNVIANFRQVVKEGDLRLHPIVTRLVDEETLKKMGAVPVSKADKERRFDA